LPIPPALKKPLVMDLGLLIWNGGYIRSERSPTFQKAEKGLGSNYYAGLVLVPHQLKTRPK